MPSHGQEGQESGLEDVLTWMSPVCSDMTGFSSGSLKSLFIVSDTYGVLGCTSEEN